VEWVALELEIHCGGHAPALADLEGDGTVEVILGSAIIEGATGALRAVGQGGKGYYKAYSEVGAMSVPIDLNGDGIQEILAGSSIYSPSGDEICSVGGEDKDGFVGAADLDMDGMGEFIVVGNSVLSMYEADCSLIRSWALSGGGNGGPPTIADFDADGVPEIGVAEAATYTVYEVDGSVLWAMPITDASSHATGSVVFDFEADGASEVVYADETRLWVFDGKTGAVRLEHGGHASRTLHEYPTVADVDGDGHTEIIVPNGGGHNGEDLTGIYVLGSESGSWLSSRQVWNQHAYNIVNVLDDLSIPPAPEPNWPLHNNFRSGDPHPGEGYFKGDLVPLAEICTEECPLDRIIIQYATANQGAGAVRSGTPITVYTELDGIEIPLETTWTTTSVVAGHKSPTFELSIATSEIHGGILIVKTDDAEGVSFVPECEEGNNSLRFTDVGCP